MRRETQKFKRLFSKDEDDESQTRTQTDDWEERSCSNNRAIAPTAQPHVPEPTQTTTPRSGDTDVTPGEETRLTDTTDNDTTFSPEAQARRSARTRTPPTRYGSWVKK